LAARDHEHLPPVTRPRGLVGIQDDGLAPVGELAVFVLLARRVVLVARDRVGVLVLPVVRMVLVATRTESGGRDQSDHQRYEQDAGSSRAPRPQVSHCCLPFGPRYFDYPTVGDTHSPESAPRPMRTVDFACTVRVPCPPRLSSPFPMGRMPHSVSRTSQKAPPSVQRQR